MVVVSLTGTSTESVGSSTQLLVNWSISSALSNRLTQCTAMGLMTTVTESVSSASGGEFVAVTVTMSVKFVHNVTCGMMHIAIPPGGSVVGKLQPERSSLLVTWMPMAGIEGRLPSMHTASMTILKQKAEQSVPDSFLMPHAFVWSFGLGV